MLWCGVGRDGRGRAGVRTSCAQGVTKAGGRQMRMHMARCVAFPFLPLSLSVAPACSPHAFAARI